MPARRGEVNLENIRKVISGMYGVVNEGRHGRPRAHSPASMYAAKPGARSWFRTTLSKPDSRSAEDMKDNAWFVGFAPRDNPEIVVAALFENGEHGQLAAPIVRDVMKAYFDKKARLDAAAAANRAPSHQSAASAALPLPASSARREPVICRRTARFAISIG